MQTLPFIGDDANGRSISDCGSIAGDGSTSTHANIQAWCEPGGRLKPLPSNTSNVMPNDRYCRAYGINNRGQIVGGSDIGTPVFYPVAFAAPHVGIHACLWDKGIARDLGALHANEGSEAYGINDKTQVVGSSGNHAFLMARRSNDRPRRWCCVQREYPRNGDWRQLSMAWWRTHGADGTAPDEFWMEFTGRTGY